MKWKRLWALSVKDMKDYTKSKYIVFSIIVLPLVIGAIVPLQVMLYSGSFGDGDNTNEGAITFMDNVLSRTIDDWEGFTNKAKSTIGIGYIVLVLVAMMPIIITSVIAAETIAGERERKTMEALLTTPLTEKEIVTGKIISSFIPSFIATTVAIITFSIVMDIILYPLIGRIFFPDLISIIFLFVVSPIITIIAVEGLILVSTRVSTVRDATQLGGLLLIPLLMLIGLQVVLFFYNIILGIVVGPIVLLLIAAGLFKISTSLFKREKALIKLV